MPRALVSGERPVPTGEVSLAESLSRRCDTLNQPASARNGFRLGRIRTSFFNVFSEKAWRSETHLLYGLSMLAVSLRLIVGLVLFAGVSFVTLPASAQGLATASGSPVTPPLGPPPAQGNFPNHQLIAATVIGQGGPVQPQHDRGMFQKVALQPGQQVQVLLSFALDAAGQQAGIVSLDGGTLTSPGQTSLLSPDAKLALTFQADQRPGLYRVAIRGVGEEYVLRFWVVDPSRPLPPQSKMLKAFKG